MSRSYRKPYIGIPKKKDKVRMHKKERAIIRTRLASSDNYDEVILPRKNQEVSNIWDFDQDGKQLYYPEQLKLKRK